VGEPASLQLEDIDWNERCAHRFIHRLGFGWKVSVI
jgi:hypothetical protein